jgi:predicted flavoprotein YhiN
MYDETMDTWDVVVVGGGPAGLMAGARAAMRGKRTLLLEKNRRPGAKILLSGGTRCNFTHHADRQEIVEAFGTQGRFLHSALAAFGPQDIVELLESEGVPSKIEADTGKVFPASDRASDVLAVLLRRLRKSGCTLAPQEALKDLQRIGDDFRLITARRTIAADKVLLATGGKSYPVCGTTGDGYRWAAALGHSIVPPRPALVPVTTHARWVKTLQGITIKDVLVTVIEFSSDENDATMHGPTRGNRHACVPQKTGHSCPAQRRGSLLFTHFGVSGPTVLDVSRAVSGHARPQDLILQCDLLPGVKHEELETMIAARCVSAGQRQLGAILDRWMPRRLADAILEQAHVSPDRRGAELSKAERRRLVQAIKQWPVPVAGTMGFRKAEVTAGGVALDEVDSRTMQSKIVAGLFFAGELLDLDGPIGGYNFQAAFSTGFLAGESM